MEIAGNLTITGPGANVLAISGNKSSSIFSVESGAAVTISNLTLKDANGSCSNSGGAICNAGTLKLDNITLSGNSATKGEPFTLPAQ
jgi:hypothetical protein